MAVSLKVFFVGSDQTKTMRFMQDMSVREVLQEIRERTNIGGPDHALFEPATYNTEGEIIQHARWLKESKTLAFYNLSNGSEVHYKKKHAVIKVKLLDGTIKTYLVDYTLSVAELVAFVGEKLSIKTPEEYSFQLESNKNAWLNPQQALDEQGTPEGTLLVFKKKFFFSDNMIDRDDPVSLHLLYIQSRDAVISGEHPTVRSEARDLAALQLQIVYGNYDTEKHKPGFMDKQVMQDFLPPSLRKDKIIEKDIVAEWRKLVGMVEGNAKYRYLQLCRSLKTYGISTYEVKIVQEKKGGKKKPEKILLGVTRSSILFLNFETKEITHTWKLTKLKRWAASAASKTFTLDFGDHESNYFMLLTEQSEEISELISGYIDIILKARKEATHVHEEEEGEVAVPEEIARVHGIASFGTTSSFTSANSPGIQQASLSPSAARKVAVTSGPKPKKIKVIDVKSAIAGMGQLLDTLSQTGQKVPATMTKEQWASQLKSDLEELTSAANGILQMGESGHTIERGRLNEVAKHVVHSGEQVAMAARSAAFAEEDTNLGLLNAAKALTDSLRDILGTVEYVVDNPTPENKAKLQQAKEYYLNGVQYLNATLTKGSLLDKGSEQLIIESSRAAQGAMLYLFIEGNEIASHVEDAAKKHNLEGATQDLAKTAEKLNFAVGAFTTGMLLPGIKDQFNDTVNKTEEAAKRVIVAARASGVSEKKLPGLSDAAQDAAKALKVLLDASDCASSTNQSIGADFLEAQNELMNAISALKASAGDRNAVIKQTRVIASATNNIVTGTKSVANLSDATTRANLLDAAKLCADAVSALVDVAKLSASNPHDPTIQGQLLVAAQKLENVGSQMVEDAERAALLSHMRAEIKNNVSYVASLLAASRVAVTDIPDQATKDQLLHSIKGANDTVDTMLTTLQKSVADPGNSELNNKLVTCAQESSVPIMQLVSASKKSMMKMTDIEKKYELKQAGEKMVEQLQTFMNICKKLTQTGGDFEEALEMMDAVLTELEAVSFSIQSGLLKPEPGQHHDDALALLNLASKQLANANNQVVQLSKTAPRRVGKSVKDASNALNQMSSSIKAVAASSADRNTQDKVVHSAKLLTNETIHLAKSARDFVTKNGDSQLERLMLEHAQKVASAMAALLSVSKGLDTKEVDEAISHVLAAQNSLSKEEAPDKDVQTLSDELAANSKTLSASINQAVSMAKNNPKNLGQAAKIVAATLESVIQSASMVASVSSNGDQIIQDSKEIIQKSSTLLNYAKATAADPSNASHLAKAAKDVADSLNRLLSILGVGSNEDCDEAIEQILNATAALDLPTEASTTSGKSLNESLHDLSNKVRQLATATSQIVSVTRGGAQDQLGSKAREAANAIEQIIVSTKNSLVASSGPTAPQEFSEPARLIHNATKSLIDSAGDKEKVLQAARLIAGATSKLIAVAKKEAGTEPDQHKQQSLLKGAQSLAVCTSGIAKAAKLAQSGAPNANHELMTAGKALTSSTNELLVVAAGPSQAEDSEDSLDPESKKRLIDSVRAVATATNHFIGTAADLSVKPKDNETQADFTTSTKAVTDAISHLLKAAHGLQPGAAEVEEAIETIQGAIGELDSLSIAVTVGNFEVASTTKSHQDTQEELVDVAKNLTETASNIVNSARLESTEALGKASKPVLLHIPALVQATKEAVSTTSDQEIQIQLLNLAKDVGDSFLTMMTTCRSATVNPSLNSQKEAANAFKNTSNAISALAAALQSSVILMKDLEDAYHRLEAAAKILDGSLSSLKSYHQYKDDISDLSKSLAVSFRKVATIDKKNLLYLGTTAQEIASNLPKMLEAALGASQTTEDSSVKDNILSCARSLASASCSIIATVQVVASDHRNVEAQSKVSEAFKNIRTSLEGLLDASKKGAIGDVMSDEAAQTIQRVITDLDAASLFAAAGQLEGATTSATGAEAQKELIAVAKQMAAASSQLVTAAKSSSEQLGTSAKNVASIIDKLAENTKGYATVLANLRAQQGLIAAAKSIAISSQQLLLYAKDAQRYATDAQAQKTLKKGSEAVADSLTALINLTQEQELESASGIESLTIAARLIQGLITDFGSIDAPLAQPDEIAVAARALAGASAQLTLANGNQEQIKNGAKATSDAASSLVQSAKGACKSTSDEAITEPVLRCTQTILQSMLGVLEAVKDHNRTGLAGGQVSSKSTEVADGIAELINIAKNLPGGASIKLEEDIGEDLEELAAKELGSAVKAIEEATAALLAAKPPERPKNIKLEFDTSDVTAAIFDSSIAISKATSTLVSAAASAQKERVGKQKANPNVYKKDPMWANGLISAAKNVAGATQQLVKSSDTMAKGGAQEEELVAVARAVAAATAQLVAASRAKSDLNSKSHQVLSEAARVVAVSTSQLVAAAKEASALLEVEEEEELASNYTGNAIKQLEQQMKVLKLEKELEKARKAMLNSRKKEYGVKK